MSVYSVPEFFIGTGVREVKREGGRGTYIDSGYCPAMASTGRPVHSSTFFVSDHPGINFTPKDLKRQS